MLKFVIYFSGLIKKSWKWKLKARNGRVLADGKGFNKKENALESVNLIVDAIQKGNFKIEFK